MKITNLRLLMVALLAIVLAAAGCKKRSARELEREGDRWEGTWQVARIRVLMTDTLGKTLVDTFVTDQGSMEFIRATDVDADVFDQVLFHGPCAGMELVSYFSGKGAGNGTVDGGWSLYWEADPSAERLLVWGIGPSTSYHRTVNLEYSGKGKSERTLSYISVPVGSGNNEQVFTTIDLVK